MSAQLTLAHVETPSMGVLAGVEMGILPNGQAFLSRRGIATLCGMAPAGVITAVQELTSGNKGPRAVALRAHMQSMGVDPNRPFEIVQHLGRQVEAFTDGAVIAFLMYYAREAQRPSAQAVRVLGLFAKKTLRELVYTALGRDTRVVEQSDYYLRLTLNEVPAGYFSVLSESASWLLKAEQHGLRIDERTIPDGSIGACWGRWWRDNDLDSKYGERQRHLHVYPEHYRQAAANGQIECWVYPEDALPEYRRWERGHYIPNHFPRYLQSKAGARQLPAATAAKLIEVMVPRVLGSRGDDVR